jgi:hypothetical protein
VFTLRVGSERRRSEAAREISRERAAAP